MNFSQWEVVYTAHKVHIHGPRQFRTRVIAMSASHAINTAMKEVPTELTSVFIEELRILKR